MCENFSSAAQISFLFNRFLIKIKFSKLRIFTVKSALDLGYSYIGISRKCLEKQKQIQNKTEQNKAKTKTKTNKQTKNHKHKQKQIAKFSFCNYIIGIYDSFTLF